MPMKAKIFISSAAHSDLTDLRKRVFDHLRDQLGHEPLAFEWNFGPWSEDFVRQCLEMVRHSDLFLLFISKHAGTCLPEERRTVTHLEFLEAINSKKKIFAFVDNSFRKEYLDRIHPRIKAASKYYFEVNRRMPESVLDISDQLRDLPGDVEPEVWNLLYDVVDRKIWCDGFDVDSPPLALITDYLSDMLRRGIGFISMEEAITQNAVQAQEYTKYRDFSHTVMSYIHNGTMTDWVAFLREIMEKLSGGTIYHRRGTYFKDKLGQFHDCSGITLYYRDADLMVRVEGVGDAGGQDFYHMDSDADTSFVVQAYNYEQAESLWYNENKKMLYLTYRINDFVLCVHFELADRWPEVKVIAFQRAIMSGILSEQGNDVVLGFSKLVLGSVRYGS